MVQVESTNKIFPITICVSFSVFEENWGNYSSVNQEGITSLFVQKYMLGVFICCFVLVRFHFLCEYLTRRNYNYVNGTLLKRGEQTRVPGETNARQQQNNDAAVGNLIFYIEFKQL